MARSSACGGGGATILRDGGIEEQHSDPTVWPHPKIWTRGQKEEVVPNMACRRGSDAGQ